MTSTIASKGQGTSPIESRRRLRILPGTRLEFFVRDDGRMEAIPWAGSIKDLKRALSKPKRELTLAEMDATIAGGAR
jgi:bifunctional DNA-binding transcriptional regulator/antitoxin component of YhaV-PrlF toxin-antitoxin module